LAVGGCVGRCVGTGVGEIVVIGAKVIVLGGGVGAWVGVV
jgi:hypothetical protein